MTKKQLIEKLKEDMEMRGFSHHTKDSYLRKAKEVVEYFKKPMKIDNMFRDHIIDLLFMSPKKEILLARECWTKQ